MENSRLFLLMALSLVSLMLYQAWQSDYGPASEVQPTPSELQTIESDESTADLPVVQNSDIPSARSDTPTTQPSQSAVSESTQKQKFITLENDLLNIRVNLNGGTISETALKRFPIKIDEPDKPLLLLTADPNKTYQAQSGLLPVSEQQLPDHLALYEVIDHRNDGDGNSTLVLSWASEQGTIEVKKTITLKDGSYTAHIHYDVLNRGKDPLSFRQYHQLYRKYHSTGRSMVPTFTGIAFSNTEEPYEKYEFDELEEEPVTGTFTGGWIAMMQHYFITALIPGAEDTATYYSNTKEGERYFAGFYSAPMQLAPNAGSTLSAQLYIGPKEQNRLEKIAKHLNLSIDYGVLWFLAKPLFLILEFVHGLTKNWGWSIILLTVIVKSAFFYPSAMGYRSMAKMRKVTPRMQQIKERYADDKMRQQQAMMELFKTEKINPLGGCFPILIQIPVFIALYWVLLESVELRHAPFVLWLQDLSAPDPYFILPLVMGATMFFQQKLNPAPLDPVQAKVMQVLPIVFTVMFAFFPAGLVLYWTVSNILSIAQQWAITRSIEQAS